MTSTGAVAPCATFCVTLRQQGGRDQARGDRSAASPTRKRLPVGREFPAGCGRTGRHTRAELRQGRTWPVGCASAHLARPPRRSSSRRRAHRRPRRSATPGVLKWLAFGRVFTAGPACLRWCARGERGRGGTTCPDAFLPGNCNTSNCASQLYRSDALRGALKGIRGIERLAQQAPEHIR